VTEVDFRREQVSEVDFRRSRKNIKNGTYGSRLP